MKNLIKQYGILLLGIIMTLSISGCSPKCPPPHPCPPPKDCQPEPNAVTDARFYYELIKDSELDSDCHYTDKHKKTACEQFRRAEKALEENRVDEAVIAAQKCIEACLTHEFDEEILNEILNISKKIRENHKPLILQEGSE